MLLEMPNHLEDIVASDLRVLLVAINPATPSAQRREHFATPTNAFWRLLHVSGLTRLYAPAEARCLLDDGIGLVSLVDRPTRMASDVRPVELRAGARRLAAIVPVRALQASRLPPPAAWPRKSAGPKHQLSRSPRSSRQLRHEGPSLQRLVRMWPERQVAAVCQLALQHLLRELERG